MPLRKGLWARQQVAREPLKGFGCRRNTVPPELQKVGFGSAWRRDWGSKAWRADAVAEGRPVPSGGSGRGQGGKGTGRLEHWELGLAGLGGPFEAVGTILTNLPAFVPGVQCWGGGVVTEP